MKTRDGITKDSQFCLLLHGSNEPTRFEFPPLDPFLFQELSPVFQRGGGTITFAPDFRFIICCVGPRIISANFFHVPTGFEFLFGAALYPGTDSNAVWHVLTAFMDFKKPCSRPPAPTSFSWAAAAIPGKGLDACLEDGEEFFSMLPTFASALLHWANNRN